MYKPIIICGVSNPDGTPVERTKEETDKFIEMMSDNGKYEVIYDKTNIIPNMMQTLIIATPQIK